MEHSSCAAERALVTAVVLGQVDSEFLAGRVRRSDFADPAAAQLFDVLTSEQARGTTGQDVPGLLRRRGLLRGDGYPLSEMLAWLPAVPAPVHPQAWGALVVAGALARQVQASGIRLVQSAEAALDVGGRTGRVLAMAEAQRAALRSAGRRWEALPRGWRDSVPAMTCASEPASELAAARRELPAGLGTGRERELLAGLVLAPQLLSRLSWLEMRDFTDPACGAVFATLRRLHESGQPVDVITLAAVASRSPVPAGGGAPADVVAALRPEHAFPSSVPYLARQMLERSIVMTAHDVGEDLVRLGASPPAATGLGGPVVTAAAARLERLRPEQVRLEHARHQRGAADRSPRRALPAPHLLPVVERAGDSLDRHAS